MMIKYWKLDKIKKCFHTCKKKTKSRNVDMFLYEPGHAKMCLMPYANNKGADQPVHPRSLIGTFVVHCLASIMSLVSRSEISRF